LIPTDLRSNAVAFDDVTVVDAMKSSPKRRKFSIERQIKALRMRVGFLERALRKARQDPSSLRAVAGKRDDAEREARREALAEFFKQRQIERYLNSPSSLRIAIEAENDLNEFLKSRGLKPEPSDIPEQFRRGLKAYQPKVPRT
jgi:ribosomal protein S15P/S13E